MNSIVILLVDDWSVLYVNGKEEYQGHEVSVEHISKYCPIESIKEKWVGDSLDDLVHDEGRFPDLASCLQSDPSLVEIFK